MRPLSGNQASQGYSRLARILGVDPENLAGRCESFQGIPYATLNLEDTQYNLAHVFDYLHISPSGTLSIFRTSNPEVGFSIDIAAIRGRAVENFLRSGAEQLSDHILVDSTMNWVIGISHEGIVTYEQLNRS